MLLVLGINQQPAITSFLSTVFVDLRLFGGNLKVVFFSENHIFNLYYDLICVAFSFFFRTVANVDVVGGPENGRFCACRRTCISVGVLRE